MRPAAITFDCAGTLLETDWNLVEFAIRCLRECGFAIDAEERRIYEGLLGERWRSYEDLNTHRDADATAAFWVDFTEEWKRSADRHDVDTPKVLAHARDRLLDCFEVFDDVHPALDRLQAAGIRTAIISNWDYTLERVLVAKGLAHRFEFALASLVEGVEKPAPRLFKIALDRLGLQPHEVWHVGDDPTDDLLGARRSGLRGFLLDRRGAYPECESVASIIEVVDQAVG